MLLKTVFHGVADSWIVFADIWAPALAQNLDICKHLEISPHTRYDVNHIKPASCDKSGQRALSTFYHQLVFLFCWLGQQLF